MVKRILIWIAFFHIPFLSFSTHIVGGELNYIYNGGSSYTIKLKLYKDCGSGAAGFPGSVTISVRGYNGATFATSKDITINLGTVTTVPSGLAPCAIPPNPMPCVQEGVYITTVNNLPPNPGGYHLYYQVTARNLSLTNINGACNCIGESYYTNIPGTSVNTIWNENFSLPNNTTFDNGTTAWSITPGVTPPASASVNANLFEITGANNAGETWTSQLIDISSCTSADLSVDLSETGNLDANDSISVYYRLNGGALTLFPINGFKADDFNSAIASAAGLNGTTIQIVIRVKYDNNSPNSEVYRFDNVTVLCNANDFKVNNNPVYNLFPPLFICVNQPFSFNHAASDINGDSLAYSLYTPYDGDVGTGPLDPTFTANTASFTPVNYLAGYSTNNPLGPTPFGINSSTGLLTGTPSTIGQFVVGVMVKEYRNGIFLSQTLRDFQFNVLNCPQPLPTLAVANTTVNNGCSAQLTATGISSVSATWNSIAPGIPGAFNNLLSCTSGCLSNTVTASGAPPAFVDYLVCGISTSCAGNYICDTFRVTFNSALAVTINPFNPILCSGQTSTTLTAIASGGTPPYSYLWNNVNPSQSINVGAGTYNVKLTDGTGCPPVYNSVVVTTYSVPTKANAGANQLKCSQNPLATLNATVTGASGGIWSGGQGTFSPNNTTLTNLFYTPSAAELAVGSASLYLTTTGNGSCPPNIDTVIINYSGFTGVVSSSNTPVSCFGGNNGSASVNITGGLAPYTYLWNGVPTQTTATANNLTSGTYTVGILNSIGCTYQTTVSITEPISPVTISSTVTNITCSGANNGSIALTPSGGTAPYTYIWLPGGQTTSSVTGLSTGTYTTNITDSKGCVRSSTFSVTQPSLLNSVPVFLNVGCFGGSNGSINSSVTGGTAPYTYSWSPGGATTPTLGGLTAGVYTLTITDAAGCSKVRNITLTQPTPLTVTTSVIDETCNNLNNGSATAIPNGGGTPGYTYVWLPGNQTTSTISNQASANYTVTITDTKGCQATSIATINEPTTLTVGFINQTNVSCFNGNNAAVTANPLGGTPNYSYTWTPGNINTPTINNIAIGTYTILVNDTKGCTASNTVSITQPTSVTVNNVSNPASCNGGNNGSITLTPSGGTTPYTYFWLPGGQTTSSVTGLSAGTYTTNTIDSKGCVATNTFTVAQPAIISIAFTQTNVSCFSGNDGKINATIGGGTAPYSYSWNPTGATTQNINGLPAGNYTLTVTDALNCSKTKTVTLTQPTALTVTTSVIDETCNNLNNGSATAIPNGGGTPGYTYLWLPGNQTTSTISNQASANYTVTITDIKGCQATSIATINEPTTLTVGFINQTNVSCFNGNNAAVTANPLGGTPNYSYTWTPGNINTPTINNIAIGTYTVLVNDTKGCTASNTVSITQPTSVTVNNVSNPASCNGGNNGSITLTPSGGTTPYTYFWLPGGQTTSSVTGLSAGTYTTNTTDSKGCIATNTFTVTQPAIISIAFTQTNVSCFNGNDGKINAAIGGGTVPYSYSWNPTGATTQNINGLLSGNYTLTVTDALNCSKTKTITLTQPTALTVTTSVIDETCNYLNNGSATAIPNGGGTPGYTYLWLPGNQTTSTISNQASGNYSVTITDAKGCQATSIATINEPTTLTVGFINQTNVSCFGGNDASVTSLGSGGTPNYSYTWTPGGSTTSMINTLSAGIYTVNVSDSKSCLATNTVSITEPSLLNLISSITNVNCNGASNGAVSISPTGGTAPYIHHLMPGNIVGANFTNLSTGTYSIITTDANGCVDNSTITINQPIDISSVTSATNSTCLLQNGVASISVTSGGTPPFTYNWLPSGGTASVSTNLFAGSYSVTVTDANGCISTKIVNINDVTGPIVSIASSTNVSCFGGNNGAITASHTGGTGPAYTYSWSPLGGTALTASNLTSGAYTLKVTDASGCIGLITSALITEPLPLTINITPTNVSCFGGNTGSAFATINGGTPGYSYSWLPAATTATNVTGLTANNYTLQITDANNCISSSTFAITQPTAALSLSLTSLPVSCFGGNNGSLASVVAGGTAPYNVNCMPGNINGANVSNLAAGNYTITATDIKGCSTTNTVTVNQPTPLVLTTGEINSNCSLANGQASVNASGGTGTYTYLWAPVGGTTAIANGLMAGSYSVTVTDINNCTAITSQTVVDNPSPVASVATTTNVSCFGGANGLANTTVVGGTAPFTYTWLPTGGTNATATGLSIGVYTVIVTAANGCTATAESPVINQPSQIFATITPTNVSCLGGNSGSASATINGGTPGYSYSWLPAATTATNVTGLTANNYTLQITDANNCISSSTFAITQPTAALSLSLTSLPVSCFGGNNGSVASIVAGGTAPYNVNCMPGNINGANVSNLTAGNYTITATDIKGCSTTNTVTVNQPTPLVLTTGEINSNCSLANGQASVNASGGTGTYTYVWAPLGGTTAIANGLMAGSYSVTVTDINNCTAITSQTVVDNPSPVASVATTTNVSCFGGANGLANTTVVGGTAPFTYTWLPTGGTNATATGLSIGVYTVIVTAANGCTATAESPVINQPSQIFATITPTNVSCLGGNSGSASATINGGTPGYSYSWLPAATTATNVTGLTANNYTLQITDANNCISSSTFAITQPTAALNVSISSSTNISCFGGNNGSAIASVTGGTSNYNYTWLPFGSNNSSSTGLTAGTYSVNITDTKGCTTSTIITITQPLIPLATVSSASMASCFGGSNGTATITPSGGTAGYSYLWNPNVSSGQTASNLNPGSYSITVTDNKGCQTYTDVVIGQPSVITGSLISNNASCGFANGSVVSQISGGTAPYSYLWSPGSSTTSTISSLLPGTYSVSVTDAKNCVKTLATGLINIPGPTVNIASTTSVSCFNGNNGSATININQGTAPYSINWLPFGGNTVTSTTLVAGTYTAHVTDALGCQHSTTTTITQPSDVSISVNTIHRVSCYGGNDGSISVSATGGTTPYLFNWLPGATGSTINNLNAGTYTLTVTDGNNCNNLISVNVTQPAVLSSTITNINNPLCFSGTGNASVLVSGGTAPYTYTWSSSPIQTGNIINNVLSGTYTVTTIDSKGCTIINTATITQPLQVITSINGNDTICFGQQGQLIASATGGAGNYYYSWRPLNAINSGTLTDNPTTNKTYTVTAFDQNGCIGTEANAHIIVYNLTAANLNVTGTTPICPGQATPISAQTTGNTGPLTYSWNNGLGNTPGTFVLVPTQPTTYVVTVSNICGLSIKDSVQVLFNPPPTIKIWSDTLYTCAPGIINFSNQSFSGNSSDPISSWQWDFGDGTFSSQPNPYHNFASSGIYTVNLKVTTDAGCTSNTSSSPIVINAYLSPTASFYLNLTELDLPYDVLACTNTSSDADFYNWSFGDGMTSTATSPNYLYETIGTYDIQLIASTTHGCRDTASAQVTTKADIVFPNAFTPNEDGEPGEYYDIYNLTNDLFFPHTSGVVEYKLQIFNRWGELIFETTDVKRGWNGYYRGKICEVGVYVWKAEAKFNTRKTFRKTGDVTILR